MGAVNRSIVEGTLTQSLRGVIAEGTESERQCAQLALDLIELAGDDPRIVRYINMKAAAVLDGRPAWRKP